MLSNKELLLIVPMHQLVGNNIDSLHSCPSSSESEIRLNCLSFTLIRGGFQQLLHINIYY